MDDKVFLNNIKEEMFTILYDIGCFNLESLKQINILCNKLIENV